MFLFADIGLITLFAFFFVLSFLVIEKFRISKVFFSLNVFATAKYILEGIAYGVLLLISYLIIETIDASFNVPMYLVVATTLIIFRNLIIGLVASMPLLLYYHIQSSYDSFMLAALMITYAQIAAITIVKYYKDDFFTRYLVLSIFGVLSLLYMTPVAFLTRGTLTTNVIQITFMPFLAALLMFFVMEVVTKFLDQANILNEAVSFNFSRYYRQSLKNTAIGSFIMDNKVSKAIYGIFEFDFEVQDTNEKNIEIRESILLDFEKEIPSKAILFRTDLNRYGFFLPIERKIDLKQMLQGNKKLTRDLDDPLKVIESIVQSRNVTYFTSFNKEVPITMKAGVIIYGVQEQSIDSMLTLSEMALNQSSNINNGNIIQLYDPKIHLTKIADSIQISDMDKRLSLDAFSAYFSQVYFPNNPKEKLALVELDRVNEYASSESARDLVEFLGWTEYFDRYAAWFALSKLNAEQHIALFYSPRVFTDKFDVEQFVNKIQKMGVRPELLTLILDAKILNTIKKNNVFEEKVEQLSQQNISFAISGIDYNEELKIPNIQYQFIGISETENYLKMNKKSKWKPIFYQLNNEADLMAVSKVSDYGIAGYFVGKDIELKEIDKKTITTIKNLLA